MRYLLAVVAVLSLAGCESEKPAGTQLPQAQPAGWEQQLPGMGGLGTGAR